MGSGELGGYSSHSGLEWSFVKNSFKLFNFGDDIVSMIFMFQKNAFSRSEQNGHFSSIIPLLCLS